MIEERYLSRLVSGAGDLRALAGRARLLVLMLGFAACGLSGCVSAEHRAAGDRRECEAQGYAPATSAFSACLAAASAGHDDAEARQSLRMRQVHEREVDNFLTSTSITP
jgi:hypothetical protein